MNIDFDAVARATLAQSKNLLEEWYPSGRWAGREYLIGNVNGDPGESLSVNSQSGAWADFSADARGGDLVSLFAARNSLTQLEAARRLSVILGVDTTAPAPAAKPAAVEWAAVMPVPSDAPPPPAAHFKHGKPSLVHEYRNIDGALLGYIWRCDPEGGKKQILPLTYCENAEGRRMWRFLSFPKPRPLYGLELLVVGKRVLIVEGEKAADAARRIVGDAFTVVTWPGGAQAVSYADWSALAGRDVMIWPDADKAGRDAAAQIVIQLRHHRATVRVVDLPEGLSDGWDLADAEAEGWDARRVLDVIDPAPVVQYEPVPEYDYPDHDGGGFDEPVAFDFKPLGHDKGRFFFFTSAGGQVRDFSARDLQSVGCLLELARLSYWEMNYPGKGESGFNVKAAGDDMMRQCYKAKIYNPDRIRGRGAWIDEGRSVLHMGDRLIVDGKACGLILDGSNAIYEAAQPLTKIHAEPLTNKEAHELFKLCSAPSWQQGIYGALLAGWLVVAPIGGGLFWRPSIWITGGSGSGKSWLQDNILRPALGGVALLVQGSSTEAGLRQALGCDAIPVLFDEAEREDANSAARMQNVLNLVRQSSSEGGGHILKGSQTHDAKKFRIRSCFAMSSINVGIEHQADESRITVLALKTRNKDQAAAIEKAFEAVNAQVQATLTPEYAAGLIARSVRLLPVIRANAETFARAVSVFMGSRRAGDQLGTLLAGAYSLHSDQLITAEAADAWVRKQDWGTASGGEVERDERMLVNHIIQHRVRVAQSNAGPMDVSIGRLIMAAADDDSVISAHTAHETLCETGIRYDILNGVKGVYISTNHKALKAMMAGTPWSAGWCPALGRLPKVVTKLPSAIRFGKLHQGRAVFVPLEAIDG